MQFRNQGEPMASAYHKNMPGLLLAFVILSALAHGLSLLFSPEPVVKLKEHRFGATIISTVLSPANDEPAAPSSRNIAPSAHPKKQKNEIQQLTTVAEAIKPSKTSNISAIDKTALKTIPDANTTQASARSQSKPPTTPLLEPISTTKVATKNVSPMTTASLVHQLETQRNYLLGELQNRLNRYLTYPIRARKRGWQGEVIVIFNINEHGQLNNVRLTKSSGYSLLDQSALSSITKLDHIELPGSMGRLQAMELQLPVRYELRES